MKSSRFSLSLFFLIALVVFLWTFTSIGCGGGSSHNNTPQANPTPGTPPPGGTGTTGSGTTTGGSTTGGTTTGGTTTSGSTTGGTGGTTSGGTSTGGTTTGGSTGGSGSSGSGTGGSTAGTTGGTTGGGTGSSSISGTIVDAQTNAAIDGTVNVLLEGAPGGDPQVVMQTTADSQGHFQFSNFPASFASDKIVSIMVSASASDGTMFTPALLISGAPPFGTGDQITPGTDVGTIPLQRSSTSGFMDGTVSSSDANGHPVGVRVTANLMTTFTVDRAFPVALPIPSQEVKTDPSVVSCGDGNGACAAYTFEVPTDRLQRAFYSRSGYTFATASEGPNYSPVFSAFSLSTGEPDCSPSTIRQFGGTVQPGGTVVISTDKFQNCQ
ncbi:MAG TPA: hypothetical protein VF493_09130 [Terriglobales bacterium]